MYAELNALHPENGVGYIWFIEPYKFDMENNLFLPGDENITELTRDRDCTFEMAIFIEKPYYEKMYQAIINGLVGYASIIHFGNGITRESKGYEWDRGSDEYKRVLIKNISITIDANRQPTTG